MTDDTGRATPATSLNGLDALIALQKTAKGPPPVEKWNPPYCGDIGMEIRSDGTWFYQNSPIGRMPLVKLFASILRKDDDGRHYLVTPVEKVDVKVADAPFLAVEMQIGQGEHGQSLVFRTNVDDIIVCTAANGLRFALDPRSGGLKPYVRVRGRLEALLTRTLYYDLVELAREDATGTLVVESNGAMFPLRAP